MDEFVFEDTLSHEPVRQQVVITAELRSLFGPGMDGGWDYICDDIEAMFLKQRNVTATDNANAPLGIKRLGFMTWAFTFQFEIFNKMSMPEQQDLLEEVYLYFLHKGARRCGSDFKNMDEQ